MTSTSSKSLIAFTRHPNPKFRTKVKVNLHPSFFTLDKKEKERFGNLSGKLDSLAKELTGNRLHHYIMA